MFEDRSKTDFIVGLPALPVVMELGPTAVFLYAKRVKKALHQDKIEGFSEVTMVLSIKDSHFSDSLAYLISRPYGLVVGAEQVISSYEYIDGHLTDR